MEENAPKTDREQELPPKITKENYRSNKGLKGRIWFHAQTVVMLLVSSFLVAFAAYCLIEPNNFTVGGVSGIAIMVAHATQNAVPQWVVILGVNTPLVVLSFFFVKRRFAVLSTANILLQSLWLALFQVLSMPEIRFEEQGAGIFAAIAGGVCIGVAIALAFKSGGSTGGADILAVMIQKKIPAPSIAWMLFAVNAVVIGSSFFVFREGDNLAINLLPIMMALFEAYIESKTNDAVTNGFQSAIEFRIITDKPEQMANALMRELSRGVTALPAKGMYTKENHTMLLCVVSRRQVAALRRIMRTVDPDAFAVMSGATQVLGLGFYTPEH